LLCKDALTPTLSLKGEGALSKIIRERIRRDGPMDMGEYMSLCLCHPEHGYYMTRDPFGAEGDFTTAPEISQMFGEMIGIWLANMWIKLGSPSECILLECGPGRGTLMADALRATSHIPGFHQAIKLYLMEISPVLRDAQSRKLADYEPRWIHDLNALPASIPALIIGNEFLDALPIRQFRYTADEYRERCIGLLDDGAFCIVEKNADLCLLKEQAPWVLEQKTDGIFEASPVLNQYISSVNNLLVKQGGAALFIDYGHAVSGAGETLQALHKHRFVNPLQNPGNYDITAHINFQNIARLANMNNIAVHGAVTQCQFLESMGIRVRAARLKEKATKEQAEAIDSALGRLLGMDQMGDLFKVIALCHDFAIRPAGFYADI
jgi:NADH dehydrogenase [ubiquinone] 1 alpha subcomplex assembly factor 7